MKTPMKPPIERVDWKRVPDDVAMLIAIGEALFGKTWQPRFAALVGMSTSHLHGIVSRRLPMTEEMRNRLSDTVEDYSKVVADEMEYRLTGMKRSLLRWRRLDGFVKPD